MILVTGAGGVFGKVLTVSGIGTALAEGLQSIGLPLILMAFILAAVLRASQGSATVAIITTAGLLAASVADGGYTPVQTALILVAIGFGALGLATSTTPASGSSPGTWDCRSPTACAPGPCSPPSWAWPASP